MYSGSLAIPVLRDVDTWDYNCDGDDDKRWTSTTSGTCEDALGSPDADTAMVVTTNRWLYSTGLEWGESGAFLNRCLKREAEETEDLWVGSRPVTTYYWEDDITPAVTQQCR